MTFEQRRITEGALFTDMYQLTMAQLYFRQGVHELPVQFDYFFRTYPDYGSHQAGYCVTAGLAWLLDWMAEARFGDEEIARLRQARSGSGGRLFDDDFLGWLRANGHFEGISLRAVPEGRVVHAGAPVAVVRGPFAMAQILETPLLNHLNYPTLIATKATRVKRAARGGTVIDFGMRRGHERGVNAGTRAALIGGVDFTSNTGISFEEGLAPRGTHAHSMVQAFMALGEGELGAFRAYADCYPDDCLLLVDTIDTLRSGVPNAITVFEELRRRGHRPRGIRLDSGDLAHLAIQSARLLDAAGFPEVAIVLSNQLDEYTIWQIVTQIQEEAGSYGVDADALVARLAYGVGTRLMVSKGDSALDGVYKLVALRAGSHPGAGAGAGPDGRAGEAPGEAPDEVPDGAPDGGGWRPAIKLSETPAKLLTPGDKNVWRLYDARGKATADLVARADEDPGRHDPLILHHPSDADTVRRLPRAEVRELEPLLREVLREGRRLDEPAELEVLRERCRADLERLDPGVKRLLHPHIYHVSLSAELWALKQELARRARAGRGRPADADRPSTTR